jgi:hypothetical protein
MELGSIGDTIAVEMALLERRYQCVKWPDQVYKLHDNGNQDPFKHVVEEVGEIADAYNEELPDIEILLEINQVAALCLAWVGDVLKKDPQLTQKLKGRLLAKTHALTVEKSIANGRFANSIVWLSD